jgi:hypothetical protein
MVFINININININVNINININININNMNINLGNYGATNGITEMFIQSHGGFINLLPALPSCWNTGKFILFYFILFYFILFLIQYYFLKM